MASIEKALLKDGPDASGLREFSVVYTDRALNHMSGSFGDVVREIDAMMKRAYKCAATAIIPGSGSCKLLQC